MVNKTSGNERVCEEAEGWKEWRGAWLLAFRTRRDDDDGNRNGGPAARDDRGQDLGSRDAKPF